MQDPKLGTMEESENHSKDRIPALRKVIISLGR